MAVVVVSSLLSICSICFTVVHKAVVSTTPLSTLRRTKEGQPPREMIRLTLRALGEGEEEIEPATDGGQCPVAVFFSVGEVARNHTQENTASDDGAARARNALRNDRALALL